MQAWLAIWFLCGASAQDSEPTEPLPVEVELAETKRLKWSGYGLPYAGFNSVDGVGFGAGGEIFAREPDDDYGYVVKITLSTWFTTSRNYNSHYIQVEYRHSRFHLLGRIGYQGWTDILYAGKGGADVSVDWGQREGGNTLRAPYGMFAASRSLRRETHKLYAQAYFRQAQSIPGRRSLLEERQPYGVDGGVYSDLTVGGELDTTDRWPLPNKGTRAEVDVRGGGTFTTDGFSPLVGVHAEYIHWQPLIGERLVLGTRVLASKSAGDRPYFEQNVTGGRWRDELGFEQAFSGYGRLRTRGDGQLAALGELRTYLFRTNRDFLDFTTYFSVFAEEALLFDEWSPGPHMPSVGFGPIAVFQSASVLRPFVSWGWQSETPDGRRQPSYQVGLSLMDPL